MPAREHRRILRSLFTPGSRRFCALKSDQARLIFLALLVNADDDGRVEGDVESVKALIPRLLNSWLRGSQEAVKSRLSGLQEADKIVSSALQALVKVGLTRRFREDGRLYIEVLGFQESQKDKGFTFDQPQTIIRVADSLTPSQSPLLSNLVGKVKEVSKEDSPASGSQNAEEVFADAQRRFRRVCRKSIGSLGNRAREWSGIVARHGAEMVIEAVDLWARENTDFLRESKFPLAHFLKNHSEWIDAAKIAREPEASAVEESKPEQEEDLYAGQDMVEVIRTKGGIRQRVLRSTANNWLRDGHVTEIIEPKVQ